MRGMGTRQLFGRIFGCFQQTTGFVAKGIFFMQKQYSIMSLLYRGTANLLVKSAVYAVISCIKGKICNAEVRF